jgi:hypothetical protein
VHHLTANVAGVISENLTNLESIDFDRADHLVAPIASDSRTAPVRAVAIGRPADRGLSWPAPELPDDTATREAHR